MIKKNNKKDNNDENSISTISSKTNSSIEQENNRILTFETTTSRRKTIRISGDKSLRQMRKIYFKEIKMEKLARKNSIQFLFNGEVLAHDKNTFVKNKFKDENTTYTIIVTDTYELISKKENTISVFDNN